MRQKDVISNLGKHRQEKVCKGNCIFETLLLSGVLLFSTTSPAYAYIDPGSGALLWQGLLAAFAGIMFYSRKFIKLLFKKY